MQLVTLTPIRTHLNLKLGVNEQSPDYSTFLNSLSDIDSEIQVQRFRNAKAYQSLNDDDRDTLCLFTLKQAYPQLQASLEVQVYSNCMSIVVARFDLEDASSDVLETQVQQRTTELIRQCYRERLYPLLQKLPGRVSPSYLEPVGRFTGFTDMNVAVTEEYEVSQLWSARLMRLQADQLGQYPDLIREWLSQTPCPEDAEAIIQGHKNHAMTWLNYVLVEQQQGELEYMLEAMCLAQYIYAVQDACNSSLYRAISDTYLQRNTFSAEQILSGIREITRMHTSAYHESLKYLKRDKKALLEKILEGWDYTHLVENSQRLIDTCSSRLGDIHTRRSEKSSFYTDLILVAIGFISLFDLAISLSQYSRAYTASATLGYRDLEPSGFLTEIANWETDNLLLLSCISIIVLFGVYWYAKRR